MSPKKGQRTGKEILAAIRNRNDLTTENSPGNSSHHTSMKDSPFGSEAGIHPSSGVPLKESDKITVNVKSRQLKTFPQLAAENGIMHWNQNVPDDRWISPPPELAQSSKVYTQIQQSRSTTQGAVSKTQDINFARCTSYKRLIADLLDTEEKMHLGQAISHTDASGEDQGILSPVNTSGRSNR